MPHPFVNRLSAAPSTTRTARLALLSYRTKQTNQECVNDTLDRTNDLLDRLEGEQAVFAPMVPGIEPEAGGGSGDSGSGDNGAK